MCTAQEYRDDTTHGAGAWVQMAARVAFFSAETLLCVNNGGLAALLSLNSHKHKYMTIYD